MTGMFERTVRTGQAVLKGATRPQTVPAQVREVGSGMLAAALYPFGYVDWGPGGRTSSSPALLAPAVSTPVLLVHGYLANKSNWYLVERDLRQAGFGSIHAMNYGPRGADIEVLAEACATRAREVMAAAGSERIHLVGHSLGGLVIRQAVQQAGLEEAASVVTVATPHGGVDLAHLSRLTAPTNTIARQLRPGSDFLRALWASSQPRPETRFVAYYSNLDLLVPGHRAMMREPELDATNVLVKDHGHLSIVLSRRLSASVAEEIAVAEVRARRATSHAA
ncbi:MAG TPA: alpha/beta fold hydrolase [Acidimicrobiales bacterium]|jgi:pimeloyl-ACP methyl ester carboxylesterase